MTAYYNPQTRQIVGCKRGTLTWYHEWRHHIQDKEGFIDLAHILRVGFVIVTIFGLIITISEFNKTLLVLDLFVLTFSLLPECLLELDAWIYALRKYYFRKTKK